MSVIISISRSPDDIWMIRNSVYRWLIAQIEECCPDQADVVERLTVSGDLGGISLDDELVESPELAKRIVYALLAAIDKMYESEIPLTDDSGDLWPELQSQVYESLDLLREILTRFQVENTF